MIFYKEMILPLDESAAHYYCRKDIYKGVI